MTDRISRLAYSLLILLVILLCGCAYFSILDHGHNWGGDFSAYIMQAQSICDANPSAYLELNRVTIEQSSSRMGPVAYPWGFPLLLAPLLACFGLNMFALKTVGVISYLLFLGVLYLGFQRYHNRFWLLLFILIFACNLFFLQFANNVLSDVPFLLFSTLSVLLIGRVIMQKQAIRDPVFDHCLLGCLIAFSFFLRTNGMLLFFTLIAVHGCLLLKDMYSLKKQGGNWITSARQVLWPQNQSTRHNLSIYLPYIVFISTLCIWRMVLPQGGSSHMEHLDRINIESIKGNALYYTNLMVQFFKGVPEAQIVYYISLPLVLVGIIRRWRTDSHIYLYLFATMILFIVWPYRQGLRFIFPVLPFYISYALSGLELVSGGKRWWVKCLRYGPASAPVVLLLYFCCMSSWQFIDKQQSGDGSIKDGPFCPDSTDMFAFIREQCTNDACIVFFKPRVMHMLTQRNTLRLDNIPALSAATHLCVWKNRHPIATKSMATQVENGSAKIIFQNNSYTFYQLQFP